MQNVMFSHIHFINSRKPPPGHFMLAKHKAICFRSLWHSAGTLKYVALLSFLYSHSAALQYMALIFLELPVDWYELGIVDPCPVFCI